MQAQFTRHLEPQMAQSSKTRRILVVEDDDSIAAALEFALHRAGLLHDRIANGAEALPRIRSTKPDLILLDVMLPAVSGYEICVGVRQDPLLAGTKIMLMTARGSAQERIKGLALGADGFVSKPFELKALMSEVQRLLQTSD
jgi:two-component system phosphate regulon response regulator PhoB